MSTIQDHMQREMRKFLIGKQIFCPRFTGIVLDVRTAVFFNDKDGDACAAMSQQGYSDLVSSQGGLDSISALGEKGVTVDRWSLDSKLWDTESSVSSQHYIDTGRFLRVGESEASDASGEEI